ncbi:hypothetical protein ACFWIO_19025 [Streptomyces diastatochromogenes]|uniref:hypothetical protein n=1 Tax=Streptomyces diastatochromogenes TaxID=42236 RepID=UPI003650D903
MPRQVDQLPPDATSLARRLQALEREVKELRAARRLTSATIGNIRTAPDGARVEISQSSQSIQVYDDDGTTLLAELGPQENGGGGGLWTRGLQSPNNMSAYLASGLLQFRPVENGLVEVPASIYYDCDAFQYSDLIITSGSVGATDHRALLILESLFDGSAHASFQGENSTPCGLDILGILTASNFAWGTVSITPSAANTPTSATVSGLNVLGSTLIAFTSPLTSLPGTATTNNGVTGTSANGVTSSGLTVWLNRQNTTTTSVNWLVIGI